MGYLRHPYKISGIPIPIHRINHKSSYNNFLPPFFSFLLWFNFSSLRFLFQYPYPFLNWTIHLINQSSSLHVLDDIFPSLSSTTPFKYQFYSQALFSSSLKSPLLFPFTIPVGNTNMNCLILSLYFYLDFIVIFLREPVRKLLNFLPCFFILLL